MSGKVFEYMAIMDRIKNVTQCRTQQELAQFFDVADSTCKCNTLKVE